MRWTTAAPMVQVCGTGLAAIPNREGLCESSQQICPTLSRLTVHQAGAAVLGRQAGRCLDIIIMHPAAHGPRRAAFSPSDEWSREACAAAQRPVT